MIRSVSRNPMSDSRLNQAKVFILVFQSLCVDVVTQDRSIYRKAYIVTVNSRSVSVSLSEPE